MSVLEAGARERIRQARDAAVRERQIARQCVADVDRALLKEIVVERPRRLYGQCPYCGFPCRGRACPEHWDLIQKDPHYRMKGRAA